ncbi:conserved hypothetical protein [Theileria equi strain WA]|uniref:Fe2OG dioxygenase domain-containing protein n=1 Tax=Theileria equi strain WA TaxID=1537102 RepID=L1LBW1_THEEQ|nr:conserved hypothetical protein [Theileria equi strain WA]EKX72816.1 conserved hypothetical protein [Theileria equi strain WA]|eukprot:XP_004832268.1 conserved hypothetical protein [Theileria equi strain WA]
MSISATKFVDNGELKRVIDKGKEGYNIHCYKRSTLIINDSIKLMKLYIHLNPEISMIFNVLEPEWIQHMMDASEGKWVKSQTSRGLSSGHPDTYQTTVSETRKSQSAIFEHEETDVIAKIERRVALVAGIGVEFLEKLVMVKYNPGDYFKEHHDGSFRTATILLYLNDVEGGETVFPNLGLAIKPVGNSAVFWRNLNGENEMDERMIHAGTTPKVGTKYVVNCFFNVEAIRNDD